MEWCGPERIEAKASAGCSVDYTLDFYDVYDYLKWVLCEIPKADAAGELDASSFCLGPRVFPNGVAPEQDADVVFADKPIEDADVAEYEVIANGVGARLK